MMHLPLSYSSVAREAGAKLPHRFHLHFMLDPVLSPSTELAGFRMVVCLHHASPFCLITCILFLQSIFFISFSTCFFHVCFGLPLPLLPLTSKFKALYHFKVQSLYHIFIFFPQNITVPSHTTSFSHPI